MSDKRFFLVKNITSGEVNSPQVNRVDGELEGNTYSLLKKAIDAPEPTGEYVHEYMITEDFNAALSLNIFTPVCNAIRAYKRYDKMFCGDIILQFQSDTGSLPISDTASLLTLLSAVLQYLNINSPHHALTELNLVTPTPEFDSNAKAKYVALLEDYLSKYPR